MRSSYINPQTTNITNVMNMLYYSNPVSHQLEKYTINVKSFVASTSYKHQPMDFVSIANYTWNYGLTVGMRYT